MYEFLLVELHGLIHLLQIMVHLKEDNLVLILMILLMITSSSFHQKVDEDNFFQILLIQLGSKHHVLSCLVLIWKNQILTPLEVRHSFEHFAKEVGQRLETQMLP